PGPGCLERAGRNSTSFRRAPCGPSVVRGLLSVRTGAALVPAIARENEMTFDVKRGFGTGAWIAGLAVAGLWSAGCADTPEADEGGEDAAPDLGAAVASPAERSRMEHYLAERQDAADVAHSFTQPSGDVVDCVLRDRQPGLRNPAARG